MNKTKIAILTSTITIFVVLIIGYFIGIFDNNKIQISGTIIEIDATYVEPRYIIKNNDTCFVIAGREFGKVYLVNENVDISINYRNIIWQGQDYNYYKKLYKQ